MRAEPLNIDFLKVIEEHQAQRARDRSSGMHLSTIIKSILRKQDPTKYGGKLDPVLAHGGFIWEDMLSRAFGGQFGRQMEIERDGVYMTLDDFNTQEWRPREFKATKISAGNALTSNRFWHWKIQTGCYSAGTESDETELYPLFLNGSYELGGGRFGDPIVKPHLLKFTKQEQQEYWTMVLRERDRMEREERTRGR